VARREGAVMRCPKCNKWMESSNICQPAWEVRREDDLDENTFIVYARDAGMAAVKYGETHNTESFLLFLNSPQSVLVRPVGEPAPWIRFDLSAELSIDWMACEKKR